MSYNLGLIEELKVLLNKAKLNNDKNDKFRVKSYNEAIRKIKDLQFEIKSEDQIPLTKTSKIYLKCKEYLEKGEIHQAEYIKDNDDGLISFYNECEKIAEIGASKAKELFEKNGIKSISELSKNLDLLNDKQKIGWKYRETDQLRIPRTEMDKHLEIFNEIRDYIKACKDLKFEILGSYRRKAKESGDIDLLVSHPDDDLEAYSKFVDQLFKEGYILDTLAKGKQKFMGYSKLYSKDDIPRRLDIIYSSAKEYPFKLLYFTGGKQFNVNMREFCTKLGYKLNDKGLFHVSSDLPVDFEFEEEKDIFKFLEIEYVKPEDRKDDYIFKKNKKKGDEEEKREELEGYTKTKLKEIAKELKIKGYTGITDKEELIEKIMEYY